jgi:putative acyl-CoA dehydrogenase
MSTHEVFNQPPPLVNYNLYLSDPVLVAAVRDGDAAWADNRIATLGALLGGEEAQQSAADANEHEPVLHTHDRYGMRLDEVVFHPAWHHLMRASIEHGVHNLPWTEARPGAHAARAALLMIAAQNEAGHTCPVSMTYSGAAVLRAVPGVASEWLPRLLSSSYDPSFRPAAAKTGALLGMGMTEKQGGSDVRANTTQAVPAGPAGEFLVTGHKWFCSAPMCDAFLVLAQTPKGLSCFLLPRWTPAGDRNAFHLQRLKRKMGNRSNASSEVEFDGAWAVLVGEEGRGITTIIEMVQHTRLDCAIASAALMRRAFVEAMHHARHRSAFGKKLAEQPLMRNVLADIGLESEAATLLAMRLARSFDARAEDEHERAFARAGAAIAQFWLCKRAPVQVGEALECLGGNGYVEESAMPRLYREAPLYSIWEGSGNVICLDVLRAFAKQPDCRDALAREIRLGDAMDAGLERLLYRTPQPEAEARILVERLAIALQLSLLRRFGSCTAAADIFAASRASGTHTFGTLPRAGAEDYLEGCSGSGATRSVTVPSGANTTLG